MEESILLVLAEFIAAEIGPVPETIRPDMTLAELGLDSLHVVHLGVQFEDHFEVNVPINLFQQSTTIRQMVNLIGSILAAGAAELAATSAR